MTSREHLVFLILAISNKQHDVNHKTTIENLVIFMTFMSMFVNRQNRHFYTQAILSIGQM